MSNIRFWVTADTHLGHSSIVEAGHRQEGFEDKILKGLKLVERNDVLINLGDVVFSDPKRWIMRYRSQCAGRIWLVRGNHDRPMGWYIDNGFDFVSDEISMKYSGLNLLFTHEPRVDLSGYNFNIHGHLHSGTHHYHENPPRTNKHILVAIENHYHPYSLKELIKRR